MTNNTLLRLLLVHKGFETAEEWDSILNNDRVMKDIAMENALVDMEEQKKRSLLLITAIDDVVPYLPEYSTVSMKLKALMQYSEKAYSIQVNRLVQGWLQQIQHTSRFRKWILFDWLECSHLMSTDPLMLLQWRHALVVATINETIKSLKRKLLGFLNAVNETMEAQFEGDTVLTATQQAVQSLETVEKLFDFYFLHAEQLASCSFLCAAKVHALAVRTQRSALKLSQDEEVMVRLRWSLMVKPMLFKPLLQHAVAMKTIADSISSSQLWTSTTLSEFVSMVDMTSREKLLVKMAAARDDLERAFSHNAKHIYSTTSKPRGLSILEATVSRYVEDLSTKKIKLLLAELERDLDEAPPYLFPHIFIFLALILGAILSSSVPKVQHLTIDAISILFTLFQRRPHDVNSVLDVLNLILDLSVADNSIWLNNSRVYLETIESLCEMITIHIDDKLQWTVRMALHQLILECDISLVQSNKSTLLQVLPSHTKRLILCI
ncbi:unnamed protein product [Peronospora belbahrii]|uniref:Uncharacterized protein n=1 Tax=Peronospora belbahrii TaxID=622444 RepID=A0AAU9KWD5_9STRA|nr:unnamed protein product [Peronospora belbahrii]CAH0519471.1 unnamed protein product [Peronospora belbahrii]